MMRYFIVLILYSVRHAAGAGDELVADREITGACRVISL